MPTFPLIPSSQDQENSALGSLPQENLFVRRAGEQSRFRYELRARTGLKDYFHTERESINVAPFDAVPEGPDYIQSMFSSPEVAGGKLYYQAYDRLYSIDGTNTLESYNVILPGVPFGASRRNGPRFIPLNKHLAYLNGDLIIIGSDGSLLPIDTSQVSQIADICFLNGRLVMVEANSGRFFWTNPFQFSSVPGLNHRTAESAGDNLIGCEAMNNELWMFGTSTIERYTQTGATESTAVFQRSPGGVINMGLLSQGAKIQAGGAVVWVSERTDEFKARQVFMSTGGVPQAISTAPVEEDLGELDFTTKQSVFMWSYGEDGQSFIVLDCDGRWTWVFSTKYRTWSRYTTGTKPNWDANGSAVFYGQDVFSSRYTPRIFLPDDGAFDAQVALTKRGSLQIPSIGRLASIDAVALEMAPLGDTALIGMELSYDRGKTWGPSQVATIAPSTNGRSFAAWRRGGQVPPSGVSVRFTWSTEDPKAVAAAYFNETAYG